MKQRMERKHRRVAPFNTAEARQFGRKLIEFCDEIVQVIKAMSNMTPDGPIDAQVQEVMMVKVPQIIEEIRKVHEHHRLWKGVAFKMTTFYPGNTPLSFTVH